VITMTTRSNTQKTGRRWAVRLSKPIIREVMIMSVYQQMEMEATKKVEVRRCPKCKRSRHINRWTDVQTGEVSLWCGDCAAIWKPKRGEVSA